MIDNHSCSSGAKWIEAMDHLCLLIAQLDLSHYWEAQENFFSYYPMSGTTFSSLQESNHIQVFCWNPKIICMGISEKSQTF